MSCSDAHKLADAALKVLEAGWDRSLLEEFGEKWLAAGVAELAARYELVRVIVEQCPERAEAALRFLPPSTGDARAHHGRAEADGADAVT